MLYDARWSTEIVRLHDEMGNRPISSEFRSLPDTRDGKHPTATHCLLVLGMGLLLCCE